MVHHSGFDTQGLERTVSRGNAQAKVTVRIRTIVGGEVGTGANTDRPGIFTIHFSSGQMFLLDFYVAVSAVMVVVSNSRSVNEDTVVRSVAIDASRRIVLNEGSSWLVRSRVCSARTIGGSMGSRDMCRTLRLTTRNRKGST